MGLRNGKYSRIVRTSAALIAAALFCLVSTVLGGCAGGAGGSSADGAEDSRIGISLNFDRSSSSGRSARTASASELSGSLTVNLSTSLGFNETKTTTITDGRGSVTFSSVPVGGTARATATFTESDMTVWEGVGEAKVTSGGTNIPVNLSLKGTWSLPASLSVSASKSSLASDTDSVTFSITNMAGAPSAGVTYSWEKSEDNGTTWSGVTGNSSSITLTGTDFGGMPPDAGDGTVAEKTVKARVTATFIRNGETIGTNSSGESSDVLMTTLPVIPAFTINVTPEGFTDMTVSGTTYTTPSNDLSHDFNFTPTATGGTFPADTSFAWTVGASSSGSTSIGDDGGKLGKTPAAMGANDSNMGGAGKTITVTCKATSATAANGAAGVTATKTVTIKKPKVANPTGVSSSSSAAEITAIDGGPNGYQVTDVTKSVTLSATAEGSATVEWYKADKATAITSSVSPSTLGVTDAALDAAGAAGLTCKVYCRAEQTGYEPSDFVELELTFLAPVRVTIKSINGNKYQAQLSRPVTNATYAWQAEIKSSAGDWLKSTDFRTNHSSGDTDPDDDTVQIASCWVDDTNTVFGINGPIPKDSSGNRITGTFTIEISVTVTADEIEGSLTTIYNTTW